jgi:radical SAM-linked protein
MVDLMDRFEPEKVSISLSSMHASTITPELAHEVRRVRKSGFTIAPEAGTQRLRNVINKNLSEEQILTACRLAYEAGWDHVKLYFMLGLPTETDADVDGMVDLAQRIAELGRRAHGRDRRPPVTMSASSFIPKAETPFQWLGMDRIENLERKQARIAERVRRGVRFKHHACDTSFLEAVFSRGDRRLGDVLERAWRGGARFDGWDEQLNLPVWRAAFRETGIDPEFFAHQPFDPAGRLPWHAVDSRVNRKWLALELKRALAEGTLSICGPTDCHGCAPFARDCVKGVVAATTDRPLDHALPLLATPVAPGPGRPITIARVPERAVQPAERDTRSRHRYRARFTKSGRLRLLGHLDLTRLLFRALRRAGVDLAYSEGFNPKPRVAFGPALAVGVASEAEYVDLECRAPLDASAIGRINAVLPGEVRFLALCPIPAGLPSLGEAVRAARYRVEPRDGCDLAGLLAAFHDREPGSVERERNGRRIVLSLAAELLDCRLSDDGSATLLLAHNPGGASLRPDEALRAIAGDAWTNLDLIRQELLVDCDGTMASPLEALQALPGRA